MNPKKHRQIVKRVFLVLFLLLLLIFAALLEYGRPHKRKGLEIPSPGEVVIEDPSESEDPLGSTSDFAFPEYEGIAFVSMGTPDFSEEEIARGESSFIELQELDELGRCGPFLGSVSKDTFATTERGSIAGVKPSGWHTVRYDDLIEDKYLYNRCHLGAYSISSLLDDNRNLITGTRYMNVEGMLPNELEVIYYIERSGNHVLYRVTTVFKDDELVARGVLMEAYSIEDDGELSFSVYCFNVQPGIEIDYATGESRRKE